MTLTEMYNVLERLRAGAHPSALAPAERRIFDDGLVLILKELHDRLDAAVAAAYGWPADLADEEILGRLVALNRERAEEERRGLVRWLRPDYQVPRFGSASEKAELELAGAADGQDGASPAGPKPSFPAGYLDQSAAVTAMLFQATAPLDAATIAARFRQGRRIEPKVEACLLSLFRTGYAHSPDGRRFAVRRAA